MSAGGLERFKARGVAFLGAVAAAERAPGGLTAVRERMPAEEAQRLEPLYVAQSYYPLETLLALMRSVAEVEAVDFPRFVVESARRAARQDVKGVYRQAMRSATPARMAERLPRIFNRYFTPAQARLVQSDDRAMEVIVAPVPRDEVAFFRAINEGFVSGALESVGAQSIGFEWAPDGRAGPNLASLRFSARWRLA